MGVCTVGILTLFLSGDVQVYQCFGLPQTVAIPGLSSLDLVSFVGT